MNKTKRVKIYKSNQKKFMDYYQKKEIIENKWDIPKWLLMQRDGENTSIREYSLFS